MEGKQRVLLPIKAAEKLRWLMEINYFAWQIEIMLVIQENVSLLPFNTFHFDVRAKHLVTVSSPDDVRQLLKSALFRENPVLVLGGGSNVLFTNPFEGTVVKNELMGITKINEDEETVTLRVGSGENWHTLVMYCVERNYGGIENLSLIPGTVGAAPMQNIGAYGVEVKDVIKEVETFELSTATSRTFANEECQFGYRESFFKHEGRDKYFISSVTLTLTKRNHRFNIQYGAIKDTLRQMEVSEVSIQAISDAVIHIRKSKLPDPVVIGNAGSFFKNPTIDESHYNQLKMSYPDIPGYPEGESRMKVPAGWLIEQCGWKGKRFGSVGVHPLQALVLVHYGGGEGSEIMNLSMKIQESVEKKFQIKLHPEVNIF